jgi:hypothetical protein
MTIDPGSRWACCCRCRPVTGALGATSNECQIYNGMSAAALQAAQGSLSRGACVEQYEQVLFVQGDWTMDAGGGTNK